jgi:hypothetical protein
MLEVIVSKEEKARAQRALSNIIRSTLPSQGKRNVGFPGGNDNLELFSKGKGQLWFGGKTLLDHKIPRYWNAFGKFDPSRVGQLITVELNIPIEENSEQVSGFFARDPVTKKSYLLHTGKIGGGAKGIGKTAFLAWSRNQPIPVLDRASGRQRFGIVIGALDQNSLVGRIRQFVSQVASFKEFVKQGQHDSPEFRKRVEDFEHYKPEFSGRKTGYTGGSIDYLSYHGDVVSELHRRRTESKLPTEVVFNTSLIDLAVRDGETLTELYEAKTSTDRQALYTAIGQLLVHSAGERQTRKFLVVPKGDKLPEDVRAAISELDIALWRFALISDGSGVTIEP